MVDRVRALGRWPGLSDAELEALCATAEREVRNDLARLGLTPDTDTVEELIAIRACALAARIVRTPVSESVGGVSASYERLDWEAEYAKALNRARLSGIGSWGVL